MKDLRRISTVSAEIVLNRCLALIVYFNHVYNFYFYIKIKLYEICLVDISHCILTIVP